MQRIEHVAHLFQAIGLGAGFQPREQAALIAYAQVFHQRRQNGWCNRARVGVRRCVVVRIGKKQVFFRRSVITANLCQLTKKRKQLRRLIDTASSHVIDEFAQAECGTPYNLQFRFIGRCAAQCGA